jgi:hypothetical protein
MQIQMAERELLLKKNTVSMKPTLWSAFCAIIILASSAPAQAPQLSPQAELAALIKEVRVQQAAMAANQAKIDEKLATLTEIIRVARIYSSRGGR